MAESNRQAILNGKESNRQAILNGKRTESSRQAILNGKKTESNRQAILNGKRTESNRQAILNGNTVYIQLTCMDGESDWLISMMSGMLRLTSFGVLHTTIICFVCTHQHIGQLYTMDGHTNCN